ncbi:MAG: hypothetical protein ABFD92_04200 [Planctomycetaceae bacterium]|nr:hypothetical protein [Planctomycetaceae bacterium]
MRIDGTSSLDGGSLLPPKRTAEQGSSPAAPAVAREPQASAPAESVPMEYISKASRQPAEDLQKIARAKQLLASGELDTPEAILRVAESLASHGI